MWELSTPMWEVTGALDNLHILGQRLKHYLVVVLDLENFKMGKLAGHLSENVNILFVLEAL